VINGEGPGQQLIQINRRRTNPHKGLVLFRISPTAVCCPPLSGSISTGRTFFKNRRKFETAARLSGKRSGANPIATDNQLKQQRQK
jgi:hypothetical protein